MAIARQFTIDDIKRQMSSRPITDFVFDHICNPYLFKYKSITLLDSFVVNYSDEVKFKFEIKYVCPCLKQEKETTVVIETTIEKFVFARESVYDVILKVIEHTIYTAYKDALKSLIPIYFPKGLGENGRENVNTNGKSAT